MPEAVRSEAGLPDSGVAILDVIPGGPADLAGLQNPEDFVTIGGLPVPVNPDVIVAIDGETIVDAMDLNSSVTFNAEIGDEVTVTILRDGVEQEIPVVLGTIDAAEVDPEVDVSEESAEDGDLN